MSVKSPMETGQASAESMGARIQDKLVTRSSFLYLFVPIIALLVALFSRSELYLDYVHVLMGALWTGIDLFMGLVIGRVLSKVNVGARVEFIKKMMPMMLFLMPSLSSVTITAGIYLAVWEGIFNIHYYAIIAAGIIVIILLIQGLGIFLPNELRIFLELRRERPDTDKISRLGMINFKLSGSQAFFQIALIFVMANLAALNLNF